MAERLSIEEIETLMADPDLSVTILPNGEVESFNWRHRLKDTEEKYHELIYAVGIKTDGETRHQTALRYITQAETPSVNAAKQDNSD